MSDMSLPWGQGELDITIPSNWRIQQTARPELRPAQDSWPEKLAMALSEGETDTPFARIFSDCRHGRIAIIVEDLTRHSPLPEILTVVLREIRHAGIADDQIEIFFANGMHPQMTAKQAVEKLGASCGKIRWRCNHYDNQGAYTSLGQISGVDITVDSGLADVDLRLIVSSVSPHLQAGFGGGYKMLFPGCCHLETIRGLHRQGLDRSGRQLVGTDATINPMRRVIDAAGRRLDEHRGRTLAIQYLLDGDNRPNSIAAGEVLATHRMIAKQCSVSCGVVVSEPADVVITNAYPRDFDLWQSFKSIANTRWAARPNGVMICFARCPGGLHGMKVPKWPISPVWMRRIVRWIGPESLSSTITRLVPGLAGDAAFFVRMATQTLYRNPILLVSPGLYDLGVRFPGMAVFGDASEAMSAADEYLGGGPQRVTVFPLGGSTFPVPKAMMPAK